ncbi:hypothetical protein R1sor_020082 [Riccia sorocarpa]|uniref:Protein DETOXIFICATION n=1 Tax=Riccia sorocarpa TaxID=122646 RepID=A0ABD3IEB1_9MARC
MGGGAAQLLHSPSQVTQGSQVVNYGKIQRRRGTVQALCGSGSRRFGNSSSILALVKQSSRFHSAAIRLKSDSGNRFPRHHGSVRKGRIVCSADNASEAAQLSSEIPPEILVATRLDSDSVYADTDVGAFKRVEEGPLSNGEAIDRNPGQKALASAVAAAVIVSDVADELKAQQEESHGDFGVPTGDEIPLDQELLNSMENQEAAAALLGDEEHTKSLFEQMREILVFAGPALGIWLSGPLMSIIDTAVVGQSSALELAALGPGTVLIDQLSYVFMFLSIATSNLIATALAHKDEAEAASHLSRLLFISVFCGVTMMIITKVFATQMLTAFVGAKNMSLVPAAREYVQIRALAWPIVLVGMVSQSACLGMKDSWVPLKVLGIASAVNLFGDIALCSYLNYGIAGAAWATMASQYIAGVLMLKSLGDKGYNPFAISIPSWNDFMRIMKLAAPILLTMLSKVSFYTLITYLATSLGAMTLAAHQVMIGVFGLSTVWSEPLAQTAQSFMPPLIYGANRNLKQARSLLRTLVVIGLVTGVTLSTVAVSVPWLFPQIFTREPAIISQMRSVTVPFFLCIWITPSVLACEGALLAGRDLKFLGFSMASCFLGGGFLLLLFNKLGVGLIGSWWTLMSFQSARFVQAYTRLTGRKSFLSDDPLPAAGASVHLKTT